MPSLLIDSPQVDPNSASHLRLDIDGMTCTACSSRIERVLKRLPGILDASVNYPNHEANLMYDPLRLTPTNIADAINGTGYIVRIPADSSDDQKLSAAGLPSPVLEIDKLKRKIVLGTLLGLPVVILGMAHSQANWSVCVQFILTSAVLTFVGGGFYSHAWKALIHRSADMNTLVAIGTGSAYLFSAHSTFNLLMTPASMAQMTHSNHGTPIYFESAVVIILFVIIGRWLEARATSHAGDSLRTLISLQPDTATLVNESIERLVPTASLIVGDLVLVKPGGRIPADGLVMSGSSTCDESFITGESIPVEKTIKSEVIGGSLNQSGAITLKVTRSGLNTTLQKIVEQVKQVQGSKAPIQRLVDQISGWFVPAVIVIASISGAAWFVISPEELRLSMALTTFVNVLIISCPCALGLATPTAIMVSSGRAAGLGLLMHSAGALQALDNIDVILVDKTGTLTTGLTAVERIVSVSKVPVKDILRYAGCAEMNSQHPLAKAILDEAGDQSIELTRPDSFRSYAGIGVECTISGKNIKVGKPSSFLASNDDDQSWRESCEVLVQAGQTVVAVAIDGKIEGLIAIADTLRSDAVKSVKRLQTAGRRVIMVTGDNQHVANAIAADLGIVEVHAEALPGEKLEVVRAVQEQHLSVAMVGDGLNDAPALAQADVGIAFHSGTDAAMKSADLTIMRGGMTAVADAIDLAHATMRTIRQNLILAFAYNVICIPIAAGALYPHFGIMLNPMMASAAMSLSSVTVVSNSLRLRQVGLTKSSL